MPTFNYQAKQGPSNIVQGTIQAATQDEAVNRLLRDGLVPMTVVIKVEDANDAPGGPSRLRVTSKERRLFTRQLTSLLRAKMELVPAVAILKEQSVSRPMRALLDDLERMMREGHPFSEAVTRHPRVFAPLFQSAIRAGEAAGKLDDILLKMVSFDEQQEQLESRLRGALAYPVLLLVLGIACLGFFIWVVVPRMAGLFSQLGGALPWPTRFLIGLSHGLSLYWPWLLGVLIISVPVFNWVRGLPWVIVATENIFRQIPFSREIIEARQIGRYTRTLQLLLQSGLPVFQAMETSRPTLDSAAVEARMKEAEDLVKRGESIANSLMAVKCFPAIVIRMIAVGESAGTLVDVLDELATYYERLLDETLRIATSLLEPLMIVLMGVLVGFCVLAMVLPIFQMTQLVH